MEKTKLSNLQGYFKFDNLRQDKRVVVFLICLLISTILWFLNALSKDYYTSIDYPVKYINTPKNQFLANNPPDHFSLKVSAHGFTLLRHKLQFSFTPIVLNINSLVSNYESGDNLDYTIKTSTLINRISKQISNEIEIVEIQPETLVLILDSLKTKKVPVAVDIGLNFNPQYNITSPIKLTPELIEIVGAGAILEKIDTIYTERKELKDIKKSINIELDLVELKKVTLKPEKIKINIDVDQFTEKVLSVPVMVVDKPDSINIKFFPHNVKVSFLVGLGQFSQITKNDFHFTVPYADILKGHPQLTVELSKKPLFVQDLKYSPKAFEYLIEKD